MYNTPRITFHSSRLLNRPQEFQANEVDEEASPIPMDDPSTLAADMISRRQTMENHGITIAASNPTFHPPAQQSFYRKYIASATHSAQITAAQQTIQNVDLSETFSSLDPSIIIACLHNAITMQSRMAGNRIVCSPAHRYRLCNHHCVQVLVRILF